MNALGMVEVFGFTTAICCADIAAKAANVKIIALDTNKPVNGDSAEVPLVMNVKMEGSVAAVEAGVSAAKAHAESKGLYITSYIISRPGVGMEYFAFKGNVGNDRWIEELNEGTKDGDLPTKNVKPAVLTAEKTDTVVKTDNVEHKKENYQKKPKPKKTDDLTKK